MRGGSCALMCSSAGPGHPAARLDRNDHLHQFRAKLGRLLLALIVTLAGLGLSGAMAAAQQVSLAEMEKWATSPQPQPSFKPGDVLTVKDLERLRPFIPPGYVDLLKVPDFRMRIIAANDHGPRKDYIDCTEKFNGQVRLDADGVLSNHVCGQPFANATLDPADPLAGLKAAWNFEMRWQNYGEFNLSVITVAMTNGGSHNAAAIGTPEMPLQPWLIGLTLDSALPTDLSDRFGGGGVVRRSFNYTYQRLYFSHLAPQMANGGVLPLPNSKIFFWKEFSGFIDPYDVRGQVFITHRYNDFHRADDAWVYDPTTRRVRRFSAEEKADSFMGTDQTVNDFYTFSGHILEWKWKFLGWRDLLCLTDASSKLRRYGPNGDIPDDGWSLRRVAVVERFPKSPSNPYGAAISMWYADAYGGATLLTFDHSLKLWRVMPAASYWTEDVTKWKQLNLGAHVDGPSDGESIDVLHGRATLWTASGNGYPDINMDRAKKLFNPSDLEQTHR